MRTYRLLAIPVVLIAVAGSAVAQRSPQRNRQRNTPTNRLPQRGNGEFAFTARSLPGEYSILLTRTIFARIHVVSDATARRDNTQAQRRTQYVFRGTIVENGTKFLAGIENRTSNRTVFYSEGGSVAGSSARVTQIALDHIIVTDRGGRRLIQIGEAIDAGTQIGNPSTMPAVANGPRPSDDSQ